MGLTNQEKIEFINNKISNINVHIDILEKDILNNPNSDVENKPSRQSVLEDFYLKKNALVLELNALED